MTDSAAGAGGAIDGAGAKRGQCTVVVGCQWGDEGKGKVVDVLTSGTDVVARYQGGANAGHTVRVGNREFVLHQIPSGILRAGKRCLLGNGVVLDPGQFFDEYDRLAERGVDLRGRVGVSTRAHLVLPHHKVVDAETERAAGRRGSTGPKIGTTGRGIGPAYEDKAGRRGVRVGDLLEPDRGRQAIAASVAWAEARLRLLGADPGLARAKHDAGQLADGLAERLAEVAADVGDEIARALAAGRDVLLEGAQGTGLDVDHGTYPFVTSSTTTAGAAAAGAGIGPTAITAVIGVAKAYTTRVGNGPLPTAFDEAMDAEIRKAGAEFGATTGRPRRCGWFDAVMMRYAARVNGLTGLAVTKLDVLDGLPEIKIATEYRLRRSPGGGRPATLTRALPPVARELERLEPGYETLPGWLAPTSEARDKDDLPPNARAYLDRIEELAGTPITMVSVGSRRSQIIPWR